MQRVRADVEGDSTGTPSCGGALSTRQSSVVRNWQSARTEILGRSLGFHIVDSVEPQNRRPGRQPIEATETAQPTKLVRGHASECSFHSGTRRSAVRAQGVRHNLAMTACAS